MSHSDEYYAGKMVGFVFGFMASLFWLSLVYSPFVFVGGYVFFELYQSFSVHGVVSAIGGIIAAGALFFVVFGIEGLKEKMKSQGKKLWIFLKTINVLVVCGLPFFIGGSLGVGFVGARELSEGEFAVVFIFFGSLLALISYAGVFSRINKKGAEE